MFRIPEEVRILTLISCVKDFQALMRIQSETLNELYDRAFLQTEATKEITSFALDSKLPMLVVNADS